MRAIQTIEFGGPEVLQLADTPKPVLEPGEVLIQVAASGINRMDITQRQGNYPPPKGISDIIGVEVAGVIVDAASQELLQTSGFQIGSEVCALLGGGGYAEFCKVPLTLCLPKPSSLSLVEAAALPETFFTVWSNVFERGQLQAGETLLIQGGSSGIGVTAIMLAKQFGATVIVTAGSAEKCEACLRFGADYAINYREQDFEEEVLKITQKKGADVILDMVSGDYVARELRCMAPEGRLVTIAMLGGSSTATIDMKEVMKKRLTITGSGLRYRSDAFKASIATKLLEKVWPLIEEGKIKPIIDQVYAPKDVKLAHQHMENSQHIGKLVIDWSL